MIPIAFDKLSLSNLVVATWTRPDMQPVYV